MTGVISPGGSLTTPTPELTLGKLATMVLGEHTAIKTELYQTKVKSQGFIYRASFYACI